jgi:UDP-N-acetylmuramyl pentapeptide phosphotransferase/UDP-N-acetylglucosamine-1-phosphate transferase
LKRWLVIGVWGAVLLSIGAILIRAFTPAYPTIEFKTSEGKAGQIIVGAHPSLMTCMQTASQISQALLGACPICQVPYTRCQYELSERQKIIEGREASEFALCFENCSLMLAPTLIEPARAPCELFEQGGLRNCLGRSEKLVYPASSNTTRLTRPVAIDFWLDSLIPFWATVSFGLLIMLSAPIHRNWTADHPADGVQKLHGRIVSRVGGLALLCGSIAPLVGMAAAANFQMDLSKWLWQPQHAGIAILQLLIIASLPAFLFGFLEDVSGRVSVLMRMAATFASAALAWWFSGVSIQRLDLGPIDFFLSFTPVAVAFTVFSVAGVANAMNIIDGLHGLSSGVGALAIAALGFLAWAVGDNALASVAVVLMAATAGFFIINYPWGRIFLGDGGAYVLGFWVAWLSVLLVARNPDVSPWACLLVVLYPVTEVVYSIKRRLVLKRHPGHPDREHLHSLLKLNWISKLYPRLAPDWQNALSTPGLLALSVLPMGVALLFYNRPLYLAAGGLVFFLLYSLTYRHLTKG